MTPSAWARSVALALVALGFGLVILPATADAPGPGPLVAAHGPRGPPEKGVESMPENMPDLSTDTVAPATPAPAPPVPSVPSTPAPAGPPPPALPSDYDAWTRVSVCENGAPGWNPPRGSAYPDSLGISATNWAAYGGGSDLSPAAQIRVADAIQAAAGLAGFVPDASGCAAW